MKFVRSAVLLIAAVAVPLMPTAAHADKYVQTDPTGDVVTITYKPSFSTAPAPTQVEGDIVRTTVQHKARKIWLTMQFQELTATGTGRIFFYGIHTRSMTRYVQVAAAPGFWGGKAQMYKASGKKVRCHISRAVNYATNTATIGVPRSCVGKPRWVTGAMQEASYIDGLVYGDDARTTGQIFNYMVFGPKVRR